MNILVTGGNGFIGSNFIKYWRDLYNDRIDNLDINTYAGDPYAHAEGLTGYQHVLGDIGDHDLVKNLLNDFQPQIIFNFAAESHVDNSIKDASPFLKTNVLGTVNLLECVRKYSPDTLFIHVSTDEVFGSLDFHDSPFTEESPYDPRSPYAASKASSDHFVRAYKNTYGLRTIITNCSNNYGPRQFPEKFIPTIIYKAINNEKVPVYGTGLNIRDWIYVKDHCMALDRIAAMGKIGETYCIGGGTQKTNLQLAQMILQRMNVPTSQIEMVEDRKGHDFRYDIDNKKMRTNLFWKPSISLEHGITNTINWYLDNFEWMEKCLKRSA